MSSVREKVGRALGAFAISVIPATVPVSAYADMQGVDVSDWQHGIDIPAVPSDFVICKATQGTWYTSGDFYRQASQTIGSGKLLGVYHYAEGGDVRAEADHFIETVRGYIGRAVLVLDWESHDNVGYWQMENWVGQWCDYVYQRTGVKPIVYCSQSIMHHFDDEIGDYGLWVAQYANYAATGYQANPWNEGAYSCAIRQYASTGRLPGYGGNLDLNKAYMDEDAWMSYAAVNGDPSYTTSDNDTPASTVTGSAYTVVAGDCLSLIGSKLGVDWRSIADANGISAPYTIYVGQVLTIPDGTVQQTPGAVGTAKYQVVSGDCLSIIGQKLGVDWTTIAALNGISAPYTIYAGQVLDVPGQVQGSGRTYTVVSGDCLSAIGQRLGIPWPDIAAANGISAPYTIYPGQALRY